MAYEIALANKDEHTKEPGFWAKHPYIKAGAALVVGPLTIAGIIAASNASIIATAFDVLGGTKVPVNGPNGSLFMKNKAYQ